MTVTQEMPTGHAGPTTLAKARPLVEVRALDFGWAAQPPLFRKLSFDVPPGVSLVSGDEGCGKTTLLRLLAGELCPSSGHLVVNGVDLSEDPGHFRQQVFRTDPRSEALDQLSAAAWLRSLPETCPGFCTAAVTDLVQGFALTSHMDKPMYMLSAGSKRKVWLTAAMAAGTPLTLLDQPFAALDTPSMRFLIELLQEASAHPGRAWVIADYEAPGGVALATTISL